MNYIEKPIEECGKFHKKSCKIEKLRNQLVLGNTILRAYYQCLLHSLHLL